MSVTLPELAVPREPAREKPTPRVEPLEQPDSIHLSADHVPAELLPFMDDVLRITNDLFPGKATVTVMFDPEYPLDEFTVIEAPARGGIDEVLDRQMEWHRRVEQLSPLCSALAITLDYQE